MIIFHNNEEYRTYSYKSEEEFENDVINNRALFFGEKSLYIDAKRKITSKSLGNTIPDGFMFDVKDPDNPEFYIVEAELYKYFSDAVENSQNILLVIDEKKKELPEIMNTYTDTWGKMVKLLVIRKFARKGDSIFLMDPEFETIEYSLESGIEEVDRQELEISEEFHLENVSENVKDIYERLKEELLAINADLVFNPQKYYISVINIKNVLFYKVRKKKIRIIVMLPEELVREKIEKHTVKALSEGVQNFYNGKCCAVDVDSTENLAEIVEIVRPLVKKEEEGDAV